MANYVIKEGLLDKFLSAIFGAAAKGAHSAAIKALSKKDPKFAKNYKELQRLRDKVEKDLKAKGIDPDKNAQSLIDKYG